MTDLGVSTFEARVLTGRPVNNYRHSSMTTALTVRRVGLSLAVSLCASLEASRASAQAWRQAAAAVAPSARVLIIGTRPEDEDNALIAWLSLGRNVETAYLSLTRGESGPNVAGGERQAGLAVVRTAELLEERKRDRAHQYFTRAYDFGPTPSDSIVNVEWPHDVLLSDVVSVIRAFRPHVVISLFSDSTERDATRRLTARLAREAFAVAGDSTRLPAKETSRLTAWTASRLFTRLDRDGGDAISIDVGEFDRISGRSFAEVGAEIRRLQRTQPSPVAPGVGHVLRFLRLDSARVERASDEHAGLFGSIDTTFGRFRAALPTDARVHLDSLRSDLSHVEALAPSGAPDSLAAALAQVVKRTTTVRLAFNCSDVSGVPMCPGVLGDLAVTLRTVGERAIRAMVDAAGIVIDGTVERELVAAGDSVPATVTVFNGGTYPIEIRRLAADSRGSLSMLVRDTAVVIRPDSLTRWSASVRVRGASLHWWQVHGLVQGTSIHDFLVSPRNPTVAELISGEDRIPSSGVEATIAIAGIDVPIIQGPLVYRSNGMVRGDARHPLAGITPISVLLDRPAEYERAGLRVDRLIRVFLSSARTTAETLTVTLGLPPGLKADSASRVVIVPPLTSRNVFFRLRGMMTPGTDSVYAAARAGAVASPTPAGIPVRSFSIQAYQYGSIGHDYPHIPSQQFVRSSKQRLESVDLRVPPRLRVAYVKGSDEIQTPLGQLQVSLQSLEPSLLSVVDLSWYTTVIIGAGALANDALAGAVPSLRDFMRNGGTVVVLPGRDEIARSGLLPYPMAFDSTEGRVGDPRATVSVTDGKSQLLNWPNRITAKDFEDWSGERARNVPANFDPRYRTVLSTGDAGHPPTAATLLVAAVGRGMFVYSSLSLDQQLAAVNPGAARLFVNLLAAGLRPGNAAK
jgi:LmbE family N-acetylglucosaminyl deacetylase